MGWPFYREQYPQTLGSGSWGGGGGSSGGGGSGYITGWQESLYGSGQQSYGGGGGGGGGGSQNDGLKQAKQQFREAVQYWSKTKSGKLDVTGEAAQDFKNFQAFLKGDKNAGKTPSWIKNLPSFLGKLGEKVHDNIKGQSGQGQLKDFFKQLDKQNQKKSKTVSKKAIQKAIAAAAGNKQAQKAYLKRSASTHGKRKNLLVVAALEKKIAKLNRKIKSDRQAAKNVSIRQAARGSGSLSSQLAGLRSAQAAALRQRNRAAPGSAKFKTLEKRRAMLGASIRTLSARNKKKK